LSKQSSDASIAAVLTALAHKGESSEELAGLSDGMRARMTRLRTSHAAVIDTAGTGASRAKTFNISTAAAFVIAAAGMPIAKHGARAATSASGSADALTALGVKIDASPECSERCLEELDICFLFAPRYHPASARVAPIRKELGFRTAFNLIGPLSNPAGAQFQVLGVSDSTLLERMATALCTLGCKRAWVVCGEDGLDELTLCGPTQVAEVRDHSVHMLAVTPEDFGLKARSCSHLRVTTPQESAEFTLDVLSNRGDSAARDLVTLNAAAALHVGLDLSFLAATERAQQAIEDGSALGKLLALREATTGGLQ
jgi:anthranilate phosphoribosyltransferase